MAKFNEATKRPNDKTANGWQQALKFAYSNIRHTYRKRERERTRKRETHTHTVNMLMQINCLLTLFKFPIRHTWFEGEEEATAGRQAASARAENFSSFSLSRATRRQSVRHQATKDPVGRFVFAQTEPQAAEHVLPLAAFCNFNFDFNLCWNIYIITDWQQAAPAPAQATGFELKQLPPQPNLLNFNENV